jgi:hypothetical protein
MIRYIALFSLTLFIGLVSCQQAKNPSGQSQTVDPDKSVVREVIQTSNYTYLRVEKNKKEEWIAITRQQIDEGAVIYYEPGLEMKNFQSPELGRTFETVYFVQEISTESAGQPNPHGATMGSQPQKPSVARLEIAIEPEEGGVSIAELYARRDHYAGKTVKVRGQVTKVNTGIMDRNWVHIQDGTADGDQFDLTITTDHVPKVGEVLTYSGTLSLEKDFGYGYFYELIMEDAVALTLR